ncbi:methyltransferase [Streptomyces sp. NPDC088182]|uniref:methyltransferase n=1 Tax=Streptomyces sp. NPDC088182 TaxID=3365838 RepID=UPI00381D6746
MTPPGADTDATAPDDRLLMDTYMSQYRLPALAAADRLGVFSALSEEPASAEDLARTRGLDTYGTTVLLSFLTALGFLAVHGARYHLTPSASAFLLRGAARYWGPMLGLGWDERCTAVRHVVRNGSPHGYRGKAIWETHERSPRHGELFARAMHAHSAAPAAALAAHLDLSGCTSLLDVAGGVGTFSMALARRNPRLRTTVMDLPVVEGPATRVLTDAGLTDRVTLRPGDMFTDPWPAGQDRVLFADVLSDWDDERTRELMVKARESLAPDGRLLIHQVLLDDSRHVSATAAGYSMALAVMTGGRLRTLPELAALLEEARFPQCAATPVYGHYALVTARPD